MLRWLSRLSGNKPKEKIVVGLFVVLLVLAAGKVFAADAGPYIAGGTTIVHGAGTPIAEFGLSAQFKEELSLECGVGLIGSTTYKNLAVSNNAFVSCQPWLSLIGPVDVGLGAGFLQNKSPIVASQGVFRLGLRWDFGDGWYGQVGHFSNAGTRKPNKGWNWLTVQKIW